MSTIEIAFKLNIFSFQDGMYTLKLAGDKETKISCPSLLPAQSEPAKDPSKGVNNLSYSTYSNLYSRTNSKNVELAVTVSFVPLT